MQIDLCFSCIVHHVGENDDLSCLIKMISCWRMSFRLLVANVQIFFGLIVFICRISIFSNVVR